METDAPRTRSAPGTVLLRVDGMSCDHCVATITSAVSAIAGVDGVNVDLTTKQVVVTGSAFDTVAVREAIEEAGYEVA